MQIISQFIGLYNSEISVLVLPEMYKLWRKFHNINIFPQPQVI